MRIIELVPYTDQWQEEYASESATIRGILGTAIDRMEHIGSTSVPGMKAKPTIDILVSVNGMDAVDQAGNAFAAAGYEALGEHGIPGRRFFVRKEFTRGADWRNKVHLHIFGSSDKANIERHLAVRDFLRTHPVKAAEYSRIKEEAFRLCGGDPGTYVSGKNDYVQSLEKAAIEWHASRKSSP